MGSAFMLLAVATLHFRFMDDSWITHTVHHLKKQTIVMMTTSVRQPPQAPPALIKAPKSCVATARESDDGKSRTRSNPVSPCGRANSPGKSA